MPKCKICGTKFTPKYNSLEKWCSPEHGYEYAIQQKEKKEAKEWRERKRELKVKTTDWKKKLQFEINKICRLIDTGLPCLARNNFPNLMNAGHILSRGGHSNVRYNLHNIHRQSAQSNNYQADDTLLRTNLSAEYGEGYLQYVIGLQKTPQVKYSNEDYHAFTTKARKIVRRLEKENEALQWDHRPVKLRMKLRDQINRELQIYPEEFCKFTSQ